MMVTSMLYLTKMCWPQSIWFYPDILLTEHFARYGHVKNNINVFASDVDAKSL